MAVTQADVDNLNSLIASGAVEIRFQDRVMRLDTMQGKLEAMAYLQSQLAANNGVKPRRQIRMITDSGF